MNKKNNFTVNGNEKKATNRERLEPSGEEKKEDIIKGKM